MAVLFRDSERRVVEGRRPLLEREVAIDLRAPELASTKPPLKIISSRTRCLRTLRYRSCTSWISTRKESVLPTWTSTVSLMSLYLPVSKDEQKGLLMATRAMPCLAKDMDSKVSNISSKFSGPSATTEPRTMSTTMPASMTCAVPESLLRPKCRSQASRSFAGTSHIFFKDFGATTRLESGKCCFRTSRSFASALGATAASQRP
mmetsp:Transcript_115952/g.368766  ORF Transcript_115952/g.368766 Transcript_115952/m.368766 type:complete len:204 (-) Transcript_115952:304-915(-)